MRQRASGGFASEAQDWAIVPWWDWPLVGLWIVGALGAFVASLYVWGFLYDFGVEEQFRRLLRAAFPRPVAAWAELSDRHRVVKWIVVVFACLVGLVALVAIPYLPIAIASDDVAAVPGDSEDALILRCCGIGVVVFFVATLLDFEFMDR